MISARGVALLGLAVPLSPTRIALLGFWPESAVEPLPVNEQPGGALMRKRALQHREIVVRNRELTLVLVAIVTSGALEL